MTLLFGGLTAAAVRFATRHRVRAQVATKPPAGDATASAAGPIREFIVSLVSGLGSAPAWIAMLTGGAVFLTAGVLLERYTVFGNDMLPPSEIRRTETALAAACARTAAA